MGTMMGTTTVITNNHARDLKAWYELPSTVAQEEFDYVKRYDQAIPRFFQYKGEWYDVNEFTSAGNTSADLPNWDQYQSDSLFSGIVIRWYREPSFRGQPMSPDYESVIVGRYYVS